MNKSIFRQEVLNRFSLTDELDRRLVITSPRNWIFVVASFLLIIGLVIWSFVGHIPIKINGQGILMPSGGITQLSFEESGTITEVTVRSGQYVEKGQVIARIGQKELVSKEEGRIMEVYRKVFEQYEAETPLLLLSNEQPGKKDLILRLYVPASKGKRIKKNMLVHVSPDTVKVEEYGFLKGRVENISEYPVSERALDETLENRSVAENILHSGPVLEVEVMLEVNPITPSGYSWSTPMGPEDTLDSGVFCTGMVIVDQVKPISYVIPAFRE